jgi:hypothetical protein
VVRVGRAAGGKAFFPVEVVTVIGLVGSNIENVTAGPRVVDEEPAVVPVGGICPPSNPPVAVILAEEVVPVTALEV